jgi:hypothetical protein
MEEPAMSLSGTKIARERAAGAAARRGPATQAAAEPPRRTAPSRAAFWLVAGVFLNPG